MKTLHELIEEQVEKLNDTCFCTEKALEPPSFACKYDKKELVGYFKNALKEIALQSIEAGAIEMDKFIRANVAYAIPGPDGGYWAIKPSTIEEAKQRAGVFLGGVSDKE